MNELYHHGIKGQKWGERNGPPYPLKGGSYSSSTKKKKYRKHLRNDANNKRHFDRTIKTGEDLSTLSYDRDRTKKAKMFYASYDKTDKEHYKSEFNKKIDQPVYDKDGNEIGSAKFYKYQITNKAIKDIKVASEDSGADAFKKLYKESRDFYNFVTDSNRLEALFDKSKLKFKGYREALNALEGIRNKGAEVDESDLNKVYRLFNYVLPNDGGGDSRKAKDVAVQRARLFKELKSEGYGALLDTNDALYGGYKANSPVIVFDTSAIAESAIKRLQGRDKAFSTLAYRGRKILGL